MALPNQLEGKLIGQLRTCCRDVLKEMDPSDADDMFLVRWLRAHNHELKSAELSLRENRRWRRQQRMDHILEGGLDTFFKLNFPLHLGIRDKRNRPVVVVPLGRWNLRMAASTGLAERFHVYLLQCMEAVVKSIELRNALAKPCALPVSQCTVLLDFNGFDCGQLLNLRVLRAIQRALTTLQRHYPQRCATLLSINCSAVVRVMLECLFAGIPALKKTCAPTRGDGVGAKFTRWCGKLETEQQLRAVLRKFVPEGEEVTKCVYLLGPD